MRKYEIMLAVRGSLSATDAQKTYEELSTYLKKGGAKITYEDNWGKLGLAYKIKKETDAVYYVLTFNIEPSKILDLEKYMLLDLNVIRSIVVKVEEENYIPVTRAMYDESREEYIETKQKRKLRSMPKTRTTTSKQLKADMAKIDKKKVVRPTVTTKKVETKKVLDEKITDSDIDKALEKELSL